MVTQIFVVLLLFISFVLFLLQCCVLERREMFEANQTSTQNKQLFNFKALQNNVIHDLEMWSSQLTHILIAYLNCFTIDCAENCALWIEVGVDIERRKTLFDCREWFRITGEYFSFFSIISNNSNFGSNPMVYLYQKSGFLRNYFNMIKLKF